MSYVFLSYDSTDRPLARALAAAIEAHQLPVWKDDSMACGQLGSHIEAKVRDARVVVAVWSAAASDSEWVHVETELARQDGKLVVVCIDDTPLPARWSNFQVLDLRGWRGEASDPRLQALLTVVSLPSASPVLLAATAPRRCVAGTPFTVALAAYIEVARPTALQHLADLGEQADRRIADVAASAWLVGAPVTVRLAAGGANVTPPEICFAWSGLENLAAFTVTVDATVPREAVSLCFLVLVADVAVAHLPLRVAVGAAADIAPERTQSAVPRSAFASYSSGDAEIVAQRLSTLARWSPGVDIFQDCLDLRPDENFKPQIALHIAGREVFLLFWSRRAAASRWVRWEYTTALDRKGVDAILPMPIEDPAIAPPPPELAQRHLRDRFLLAGYALAKVHEDAKGSGVT
jgi:hypothetical protein